MHAWEMASFHSPHGAAVDLEALLPTELAELVDHAVANIADAALELAPTCDPAELTTLARLWIDALDRPSLANVCTTVAAPEPRRAVRLVACVLVTTCQRRAPPRRAACEPAMT